MLTSEDVAVSVVYVFLWALLSSLYCLCLITIRRTKTLWTMACYKIMMAIGICDMLQVFVIGLVTAVFMLCQLDGTRNVAKVIGAMLLGVWFSGAALTATLAFNRFMILTSGHMTEKLFGSRRVYVWIACCSAYGCVLTVPLLTPDIDNVLYNDTYIWFYRQTPETVKFETYNMCYDLVMCSGTVALTVAVLVQLWPVTVAVTLTFNDLYFYVSPNISTDWWTVYFTNVQWLVLVGINGALIMNFNRTVKQHALALICGRQHNANIKGRRRTARVVWRSNAIGQNVQNTAVHAQEAEPSELV